MFRDVVKALVLPCVTLAFVVMAPIARFTRATMAEVLESDYIRTARSLGLPFRVVTFQLALKNALIGILTIIAAVYGFALGGEVLVEIIFNWPGLGQYRTTRSSRATSCDPGVRPARDLDLRGHLPDPGHPHGSHRPAREVLAR